MKGVDISALPAIEAAGGVFTERGIPRDPLIIFRDHGGTHVRLRLWHSPADGSSGLEQTLAMARRVAAAGMKILLDLHYSDSWADPGQQTKPAAWQSLSFSALRDSVYRYTSRVMSLMKNQGTLPDIVQPGNEIICGMLWNDGRVCGGFDTPAQWAQLAALLDAATRGVRDSLAGGDSVRIMIHVDRGGDNAGCRWFYDNLLARSVEFDIIGLSYYPWWHGTLGDLAANLQDLAPRYGKEIVLVETAYPWTLGWNDTTHNIVGSPGQLHAGYAATPEGQGAFLRDLFGIVASAPQNLGAGLFTWAPEWISAPQAGSPWENLALFDFSGELLGSIAAFDSTIRCAAIGMEGGWNLVSLPYDPPRHFAEVVPGALSPPFRFDGTTGYVREDTMAAGGGYWIRMPLPGSVLVCGDAATTRDIGLLPGWNLVGTCADTTDVGAVTTTPEGILASPFIGFAGTYQSASVLLPGRGYWIKSTASGTLHLPGGSSSMANRER